MAMSSRLGLAADECSAYLDSHKQDLLLLAQDLVKIDSQDPPIANEVAVVHFVRRELVRLGLPAGEVFAVEPDRPNLVLTVPGSGGDRRLMLAGHLDTKPVGDARGEWRTDPLVPEVIDDRLFGLGSADMKAACAAMIYALLAVRDTCADYGDLVGDVTLALTADEEAGSRYGARYLAPLIADRADACLIGEPSGWEYDFQAVHAVSRGLLAFTIETRGTQGHSSLSDRMPSVNASVKMAGLLNDLAGWQNWTFTPHPLSPAGPTLNPGVMVGGGVSYGVVPARAWFACDLRTLPGMTPESILADLNVWLDTRRAADPEVDAVIRLDPRLPWLPPSQIATDHQLVATALDAAERVLGVRPPLSVFPGGTDAPWFDLAGLPTLPSLGPGVLTCCHGPNEYVSVPAIIQAAKIYAHTILGYAGQPRAS